MSRKEDPNQYNLFDIYKETWINKAIKARLTLSRWRDDNGGVVFTASLPEGAKVSKKEYDRVSAMVRSATKRAYEEFCEGRKAPAPLGALLPFVDAWGDLITTQAENGGQALRCRSAALPSGIAGKEI